MKTVRVNWKVEGVSFAAVPDDFQWEGPEDDAILIDAIDWHHAMNDASHTEIEDCSEHKPS